MASYFIRRILRVFFTLFFALTMIFLAIRVLPGDPAEALLGQYMSAEGLATLRQQMGLDLPVWKQYLDYFAGLFRGDLGNSLVLGQPAAKMIVEVIPYTLIVVVGGLLIGSLLGIPLGILSAVKKNTAIDYIGRVVSLFGISLPGFAIGILLMILFSIKLGWFPIAGGGDLSSPGSLLKFGFLPALAGGLGMASYLTRISRTAMLEVLNEDYIRTAKAKGVKAMAVISKHALRNSLISIVSVISIYAIVMVGDSIAIEIAFSRPGFGRLIFGAITQRDYFLIQAIIFVYVIFATFINLLTDLIYAIIDPRISYK